MEARKAEFEKTFKHVWNTGAIGLSAAYATFKDKDTATQVITALFKDTIISEVTAIPQATMTFKNETRLHQTDAELSIS